MRSQSSPRQRYVLLTLIVVAAVLSRSIPHPLNFTPIGAIALFGGARFKDRRVALALPLAILFVADLFVGLHVLIPVVYASFAIDALLGRWLRIRGSFASIAAMTLLGSIQFFLVTNFASWLMWYPPTAVGFADCYAAALPYFRNTLLGDAAWSFALFGGLALLERGFPVVRESASPPVAV